MVGNKGASEIARFYGGKDHTTVLNHIARARELMETDELFAETISLAEERLMQLVSVSQKPTNGLSYGQR
jgi:hypothetical protein